MIPFYGDNYNLYGVSVFLKMSLPPVPLPVGKKKCLDDSVTKRRLIRRQRGWTVVCGKELRYGFKIIALNIILKLGALSPK